MRSNSSAGTGQNSPVTGSKQRVRVDVNAADLELFEAAAVSVDVMQLLTGDPHPPSHAAGAGAAAVRFLGYCMVSGRLAY